MSSLSKNVRVFGCFRLVDESLTFNKKLTATYYNIILSVVTAVIIPFIY